MKRTIGLILFTIGALVLNMGCQKNTTTRPNILVINIDDMGWKDVGFMGSEYYHTPNIDNLSTKGMVFTNGYASASNCAPSRACLMTGKWTPRHGIYTVGTSERGKAKDRKLIPIANTEILAKEHNVIPELLKELGYITCHAGKWHLSENPLDYGFDINIAGCHWGAPKTYYAPFKVNIQSDGFEYLTDAIANEAIHFLDTVKHPFFLYYSPYAVHAPIQSVDSLLYKYQNKPAWNGQNNVKYATMVENLDRNVGLIIDKLKKQELYKNTFIVFTSDNGGHFGFTKQKPLRSGKGSYYEGGIRVPFFFVWEKHIQPETKCDVPVTNLDILPTILGVIKSSSDTLAIDGDNLFPILTQEVKKLNRALFWHFPIYLQGYNVSDNENRDSLFRTRPGSVMRHDDWKLHYYFENNEVELYNLAEDIGEQNDLSEMYPEMVDELKTRLQSWWHHTNAPIPTKINPEYMLHD